MRLSQRIGTKSSSTSNLFALGKQFIYVMVAISTGLMTFMISEHELLIDKDPIITGYYYEEVVADSVYIAFQICGTNQLADVHPDTYQTFRSVRDNIELVEHLLYAGVYFEGRGRLVTPPNSFERSFSWGDNFLKGEPQLLLTEISSFGPSLSNTSCEKVAPNGFYHLENQENDIICSMRSDERIWPILVTSRESTAPLRNDLIINETQFEITECSYLLDGIF